MTDRPILDIPIDSSAFEAFRAKFDAYRAKVGETSSAWAEIGKTTQASAQTFDKMAAALAKMQAALSGIEQSTDDAGEEQAASSVRWTNIASSAKVFGSNVKDASLSLAKWSGLTGLFAGILSAGGLYGISRMAAGVSSRRSQAMSYGMGYGDFQSYQTNFSRLGNAGGLLAGFNNAMTSAENRGPLYALMGADADRRLAGKSAGQALAEALPDIKRFVDKTDPRNLAGALHGTGLDRLGVDMNTALAIRAMSPQELGQISRDFAGDAGGMNLPPDLALKWQEFDTTLSEAGAEIENHFATNLVNLAPGLTRLADATSNLVDHMLKDGGPAEKWLERVNKGMVDFSNIVGEKETLGKIDHFVKDVGTIGALIARITKTPLADAVGLGRDLAETGADFLNSLTGQRRQYDKTPSHFRPRWGRMIEGVFGLDHNDYVAKGPHGETNKIGVGVTPHAPGGGSTPSVRPEDADQSTWDANTGIAGDLSGLARYRRSGEEIQPDNFIMHWTGGGGSPSGVVNTLNQQGYAVQYVMDKDGKIYRTLPEGHRGAHLRDSPNTGASNSNSLGMEIIADPYNGGYSETQIKAAADFARAKAAQYGFSTDHIYGHGEVNPGHKMADEGLAPAQLARSLGPLPNSSVKNHAPAADQKPWPVEQRTIGGYMRGEPDDKLIPIKPLHPHLQGQTNIVHVDDETGDADVRTSSSAIGPMSYGADFGRFAH